jgi:Zn ribbon nucleic-acid-binding protein
VKNAEFIRGGRVSRNGIIEQEEKGDYVAYEAKLCTYCKSNDAIKMYDNGEVYFWCTSCGKKEYILERDMRGEYIKKEVKTDGQNKNK